MKLLLISNSTNAGEEYLRYPLPEIGRFLDGVRELVFVPYAAVTFSYAAYEAKVQARLAELGIRVRSVHRSKNPAREIRNAEAICVGGGNTFALAKRCRSRGSCRQFCANQGRNALRRVVGRQQRRLPHHLHHQRHAHRPARVVPGHRRHEVPD